MILKLYLNSRSVLKVRKSMRKLTTPMYIYFISHFFYGQYFNVLGALIPYLTEETGRS